ncbi:MAG: response regulator [Chloroflexota bacterium]
MSTTGKLTLLLADDHALLRSSMRALLAQQPDLEVIGEAADGHAILDLAARAQPDVVLLDISLPGINGLEMIPRIRAQWPQAEIVVLSMHNIEEYILRAYQEGALCYLTKDTPPGELVAAIRAAGRRERYYPAQMSAEQVEELMHNAAPPQSRLDRLTRREREALQLLAEGYSTAAIAHKMGVSPKTVETYRARLSAKLKIYDVASLTRFAILTGLISAG